MNPTISIIAGLLHTQDNQCTAHPIYLVQQLRRDYGYDPAYSDETVWVDEDGDEVTGDDISDACTETGYVDRWEYVTTCFTESAAKEYIARNSHRHDGKLRVYVDSLYSNPEMIAVREYLMSLAPVTT